MKAEVMTISILSDSFKNGDSIPDKCSCKGADISPHLSWSGSPEGTRSYTIIMEDPDAPGGTFTHWVICNIPANVNSLPEGVPKQNVLDNGAIQGKTDFGGIGYGGPCPPPGKPHRYYFRIYALDTNLNLTAKPSRNDVLKTMKGHVLAQGELMGTFRR